MKRKNLLFFLILALLIKNEEVIMPGLDGTGPAGQGPKTGGQRGNCPGANPRPRPRDGSGRGMGRGGRGRRRRGNR